MTSKFQLTAIGNAIVDILASTTEEFLTEQASKGMNRASMTLIDENRARELYPLMNKPIEMSGGSAANTMACFSALGGQGAFFGKVSNDRFGKNFANDMVKSNIYFNTPALDGGPLTAQCLIFVEDNGNRTMNTYLGASVLFSENDVEENIIANSEIIYLEGYLFDKDEAKKAFLKAAEYTHKHNRKLSLTLSDTFCVQRHRDDFLNLIEHHVDILFANHFELLELYQMDNLDDAMEKLRPHCDIAVVTRGEDGSTILTPTETIHINAFPVAKVVDTTGAGDAYAAGFLYGVTHHYSLQACGDLGSRVAAEIIAQMGPRPQRSFEDFKKHAA